MKKVAIIIDQSKAPNEETFQKILEFFEEKLMMNNWETFRVDVGSAVKFIADALQQAMVLTGEVGVKDQGIAKAIIDTLKNVYGEEAGEKILVAHPYMAPTESQQKLCCVATVQKTSPGDAKEAGVALRSMGYEVVSVTIDNSFNSIVSKDSVLVSDFDKSVQNLNQLLKEVGVFVDPKEELEELVGFFNERFSVWCKNNQFGANFEFHYEPETGVKKIKIKDCAELSSIPEDLKAIKIGAVEKVMEGLSSQV